MIADQPLQGSGGDERFYSLRSLVRVGGWPSLGLRSLHCRLHPVGGQRPVFRLQRYLAVRILVTAC